ncbi:MAG: uncharacterized protein QOJ27_920 [Sphingomonadales bacterium]|nr:uncharacterized protein [Sphingomonadales bacterium]
MPKMIFLNLPVSDLGRSVAFYEAFGATKNPQFSNDQAACMVLSETISVMLLTHAFYGGFTSKPIADAHSSSEALICVSEDSREAVDATVERAAARRRPGRPGAEAGSRLHVRPKRRGSRRPPLGSDVDGRQPGAARPRRRLTKTKGEGR